MSTLSHQHIVRRLNMRNRIYNVRRNPDWLVNLARWIGRKRRFLAQDWQCTKGHLVSALKFVKQYHGFRKRGFTRKAARFNARSSL